MKHLTNSQLIKKHESISKKLSALSRRFIEAGLGHLRPSDMRERGDCSLSARYVKLSDERGAWRREAESRYGPGFIYMDQLKSVRVRRKRA